MQVTLNDDYRLTLIDHNWRIEKFHPSVLIKVGPSKGKMSRAGFKLVEKFWPKPEQALRWVITQMMQEYEEVMTLHEFEKKLESLQRGMVECFNANK